MMEKRGASGTGERSGGAGTTGAVGGAGSRAAGAVGRGAVPLESPGRYARPAGVLYLVIAAAAIVAHMYMPTTVFGAAGAATAAGANSAGGGATGIAAAVVAGRSLFLGGGLGGELVILISETVLSVLLFALLAPVDRTVALIAAVARLVMTAIHGFNLVHYVLIARVAAAAEAAVRTGAGTAAAAAAGAGATASGLGAVFAGGDADMLVSLLLESHGIGFAIGIAFLPLHMGALGYLMWRSGYIPRWIGVLFLLSGAGYLIDTVGLLFVPSYTTTPGAIATVIAAAEMIFPVYLLIRGRRIGNQT